MTNIFMLQRLWKREEKEIWRHLFLSSTNKKLIVDNEDKLFESAPHITKYVKNCVTNGFI